MEKFKYTTTFLSNGTLFKDKCVHKCQSTKAIFMKMSLYRAVKQI